MEKIHEWFNGQECTRDADFKDKVFGIGSGLEDSDEKAFD